MKAPRQILINSVRSKQALSKRRYDSEQYGISRCAASRCAWPWV